MRWAWMVAVVVALVGCDMGTITKRGVNQWTQFAWAKDGEVSYDSQGTQEAALVIAEGAIVLDANGNVDPSQSAITHYAKYEPSATVAGETILGGMEHQAQAWASFLTLAGQIAPLVPGVNQSGTNSISSTSNSDGASSGTNEETNRLLRELLVEIRDAPDAGTT